MAKVKGTKKKGKLGSKFLKKGGSKKKAKKPKIEVDLPTEPEPLSEDLRAFSMLIHGEKKIGKTSLLSHEQDAFFLEFDPKQQGVSIMQRHIPDWPTLLAYISELEKRVKAGTCEYKTIIVDGLDLMYTLCFKWACKQLVIEHPHDENDFGKSWGFIKENFREAFLRLRNLPGIALRLLCHSRWIEVETRKGKRAKKDEDKVTKLVPILTGQAEEAIVADVDIWAAYVYDGKSHVLVVKGDERTGAGHRVDHAFRTPDGEMVEEIYLGQSSRSAYEALVNAFENRQPYIDMEEYREMKRDGTLKQKPAKPKSGKKTLKLKVRKRR